MRYSLGTVQWTLCGAVALLAIGLLVVSAPEALAHGGGFNSGNPPPPGSVPNAPPTTPPPPPPPPSPPDSTESVPPGNGPGDTTPPAPPPEPPPTTPPAEPPPTTPPAPDGDTPAPPPTPDDGPEVTGAPPPPNSCGDGGGPPPEPPPEPPTPPPSMPDTPTTADPGSVPMPTAPGGPTTGRPTPRGRTALRNVETEWTLWWELNRWRYLPSRATVLRRQSDTITGGDVPTSLLDAWERRRAMLSKSVAIPYLWKVLNPASTAPEEVQAAALIALGRVAQNPEAIDLVLHYAMHPRKTQLIRESAAIALGHFRRTDPGQRFDATRIDLLRRQLLKVVDDGHTPLRARAFAAMSIGMLGDQPFSTSFTKEGRLVTRELWDRLANDFAGNDLPVALLTALGMQPGAGVPEAVRDGLQAIALGKRLNGRSWSAIERSHALSARIRIGGRGWPSMLNRVLSSRQVPAEVRRAGFIGLSGQAANLADDERMPAFEAWQAGMRRAKDPLTQGLAHIALGHLLAADLDRDGASRLLIATDASARLQKSATSGNATVRGFGAIALGIAARAASSDEAAELKFRTTALTTLRQQLQKGRGDDSLAAAFAAALGVLEDKASVPALVEVLRDRGRSPELRGRAAVALAQIGNRSPRVMVSLQAALMDRRNTELRKEAALALSFLAKGGENKVLLADLDNARSQRSLAQTALALGQIGQLDAVKAMLAAARDNAHNDEPRALAVAAMGLILNPEERPSLTRIRFDANYPARTNALHEVFDIL